MRILVDILHPKQAHFFRPLIVRWQARGDTVQIVTRDKDITHLLLRRFGFSYRCLSRQQRGAGLVAELLLRWGRMARLLRRFRPDVALSVTGISTALPARLLGIPNIAFTDTETAVLSNRIAFPFADRILTPAWFVGDFGPRHHRYRGFHEWAYLHPAEFQPDPDRVRAAGINPDEPYAVVRFVRWNAVHDRGELGLHPADAVTLVQELARRMRVYLTSEVPPPPALQPYLSPAPVELMHHVLAFARLLTGESPSMGTEAALLGVPSVVASTWAGRCGNMQVLEREFGLMQVFRRGSDAVQATLALAENPPSAAAIAARRAALVQDLEYIPDVVERHLREVLHER
ncbi:MAG: DUF354 domain-containing protein [Caldilineae bacterium]|nr:MAG: DUF354 domain-containing protein [Caldilineae bacterium]